MWFLKWIFLFNLGRKPSPWRKPLTQSTTNHAGEMQDFWGFQKRVSTPVIEDGAKKISWFFQKLNNPGQPHSRRFLHRPIVFVFKNFLSGLAVRCQIWAYEVRLLPVHFGQKRTGNPKFKGAVSHFGGCLRPRSEMKFGDLGSAHFPSWPRDWVQIRGPRVDYPTIHQDTIFLEGGVLYQKLI